MKKSQLEKLIKAGESTKLEFKKTTSQLRAALETLCAFLNRAGGTVLLGVTDQGKILGQDVSDATKQEIANELRKIEPHAPITVEYCAIDAKKFVIALQTKPGSQTPYVYDGRPFQREQSVTMRMPQQRYDLLVSQRAQVNFSWEDMIADRYSVSDLDTDLIYGVVRQSVEAKRMPETALRQDIPKILDALQLQDHGYLKNAAIALFAKEVFPIYPQCHLRMARFKGLDRQEFIDSDALYGNVFVLLDRGMQFVAKHLPVAARIEPGKLQRVETPLIPFSAIREALINTLCHRDYSSRGSSIGLAMYDDRLEITNHGGLLPQLTLAKIKAGHSKLRNPLIAEVFYRCKIVERWGRGVPEMIKTCKEADDPEPQFIDDKSDFTCVFKFPRSAAPQIMSVDKISDTYPELTVRQNEILSILGFAKTISTKNMLEKLSNPPAERTLRDDLAALKKRGLINSRGHARKTLWFLLSNDPN